MLITVENWTGNLNVKRKVACMLKVIDKRLELPLLTPWVPLTSTRTHPKFYLLLLLSNKFRSILFAFPVYATCHAKNKVTLENRNTNTRDVDVVLKSVCPARSPREMCCYHNQIEILPGTYHFEGYTLYSRNYIWRILHVCWLKRSFLLWVINLL